MSRNQTVRREEAFPVPVVLFTYRRLDTVKLILDEIEKVRPRRFYVFSDGARAEKPGEAEQVAKVREYVKKRITWECEFVPGFAENNMGCANRITSGLDAVFEKEEEALVFEDDAVPTQEYFWYCRELLEKYKGNPRIQYITGFNFIGDTDCITDSYTFSFFGGLSGAFATWRERWQQCDFAMKSWKEVRKSGALKQFFFQKELYRVYSSALEDSYRQINDGWDYQFQYDGMWQGRLAVVPKGNLVESYGYAEGAFHKQEVGTAQRLKVRMQKTKQPFSFPMTHPKTVEWDKRYDKVRQRVSLEVTGNYWERHLRYMKIGIKDFLYPFYVKLKSRK